MVKETKKLALLLEKQKRLEWDLDNDLPWEALATHLPLLPMDGLPLPESITANERLALSQFLGIMAIAAIAEHESILGVLKTRCMAGISPSMLPITEQFFKEESKHSAAFARYIRHFAQKQGIPISFLEKVLPKLGRKSWTTRAFVLNHSLGGNAIWHLVQATELESIDLYRYLKNSHETLEPLYLALNRLHYEEETRHISVPPLILARANGRKLDRKFSRWFHLFWAFRQFLRLGRLREIQAEHPFFKKTYSALQKLSLRQRLSLFYHIQIYIFSGRRLHTQLQGVTYEN